MIVIDRFADVGIKNEDVDQEVVGDLIRHVENVDNERRRRPRRGGAAPVIRKLFGPPASICMRPIRNWNGRGVPPPPSDQRWHAGAVGSSAQIEGASTCCKHRLTAKSVRRTATTNQIMVVRDIGSSLSQLIGHVSLRLKGPGPWRHCQAIQTIIDQLTETESNTELRLLSQRLQRFSRRTEESRW
jgi:hypothetical protein